MTWASIIYESSRRGEVGKTVDPNTTYLAATGITVQRM
jgi:hypothetical protein